MKLPHPLSPEGRARTAAMLAQTFRMFAALEPDPRAYVASLIPHNFAHVRRVVRRRAPGWRGEAVASLIAVRVAREILS